MITDEMRHNAVITLIKKYRLDDQSRKYDKRESRLNHSISVMMYALKLAEKYDYQDIDKVFYASIFHDYAKFEDLDKYKEIVEKHQLSEEYLESKYDNVRHALLGYYIVEEELGISDSEILNAIKYHATGKGNMTTLEKIIYISDYAEFLREGEMFDAIRNATDISLDYAVLMEAKLSIENIKKRNIEVLDFTVQCYEYYKRRINDFTTSNM